jgi:ferric-dicitrate binding protein FerR (iron transport regulator)
MRRPLPSTRFRRLGALAALAALVAAACFGLSAHADTSLPAQATTAVAGR